MIESIKYKIFINRIRLKNFMKFDEIVIDNLADYKILVIAGRNGSGKSTITSEALFYNLFGNPIRTSKSLQLIKSGKNLAEVEIEYYIKPISSNNEVLALTVIRTINEKKNKLDFYYKVINVNTKEEVEKTKNPDLLSIIYFIETFKSRKINEMNQMLQTLFKINKDIFMTINIKSPFSISPITNLNEVVLKELVDIEKLKRFNDFLKDKYNEKVKNKETLLSELNKFLSIKEKINKKSELQNKIEEYKKEYVNCKNEYEKEITVLKKLESEVKEVEKEYLSKKKKLEEIKEQVKQKIAEKSKIEGENEILKKEYLKIKNLKSQSKCPVCFQDIDEKTLKSHYNDIKDRFFKNKTEIENIEKSINELKEKEDSIKKIVEETEKRYQLKYKNYSETNSKVKYLKNKLEDIKSIVNSIKNQISSLNIEITDKINEVENEIKSINIEIDNIKYAMDIFNIKSEYVKSYINISIKKFNEIFERLLILISNNKFYSASLYISKNNQESLILNHSLYYSNLSTSERKIIDLTLTLALIIYSLNINPMPIILDEYFDNFDLENADYILKQIIKVFENFNSQIFITTNVLEAFSIEDEKVKIIDLR